MAKKTKDFNLSIEEKLEQALIPNWDEPYKLPDNWCWTRIGTVAKLYRGVSYKKHEGHSEKSEDDCLVMRGGNILEGEIDVNADNIYVSKKLVSDEQYVKKYDVVIVSSTGSTKVIGRAGISFADYDDVAFGAFLTLVRPVETVYKPYVSYYFQSDMYRNRMRQLASGVNINNIRNEYITDTPFPIPPLEEQKRIVSHIELLFAKLDEAQEKAQEVVDGFETRKAAILHKAFSGELTAKWREENGVKSNDWELTNLQDVCEKIVCGKTPTEYIAEHGEVPFLKVYNIVDNQIDFETNPQFIPQSIQHGKLKSSVLKPNDVIMNIVGPPLRKIAIIPDTYPEWNMNQAIVRFRPREGLSHKFLYYALINPETLDDVIAATRGVVGQANISVSQSRSLTINMPSWDEQIEVVKILDCIIEKERDAKDAAIAVIEQIDTMKKAILARAFRGELGTNDPDEESALELLKSVLLGNTNQQEPQKNNKKSTSIPNHIETALLTKLEKKIVSLFFSTERKVVSVDEIMSVSSKKIDIIDTLTKLEERGIIIRLNNSCYRIKE